MGLTLSTNIRWGTKVYFHRKRREGQCKKETQLCQWQPFRLSSPVFRIQFCKKKKKIQFCACGITPTSLKHFKGRQRREPVVASNFFMSQALI